MQLFFDWHGTREACGPVALAGGVGKFFALP